MNTFPESVGLRNIPSDAKLVTLRSKREVCLGGGKLFGQDRLLPRRHRFLQADLHAAFSVDGGQLPPYLLYVIVFLTPTFSLKHGLHHSHVRVWGVGGRTPTFLPRVTLRAEQPQNRKKHKSNNYCKSLM